MTKDKIVSQEQAAQQIAAWQAKGESVVFTNGCFDILHLGHIDYLEKARAKGQRLVVGLNSDASVRRIKGEKRPVVPENARARLLAALAFVDLLTVFEEDTPLELITSLKPDVLVKGDDYSIDTIVGADVVMANGGRVETLSLVEGFSTSLIIEKIRKAYQLED